MEGKPAKRTYTKRLNTPAEEPRAQKIRMDAVSTARMVQTVQELRPTQQVEVAEEALAEEKGIGYRIKQVRVSQNLTQEEFSKRISVSRPFISNIENGRESASPSVLKLISYAFDIDLGWLLNGEGEMFSQLDLGDSLDRDPALSHEIHSGYRNIISSLAAFSQNPPLEMEAAFTAGSKVPFAIVGKRDGVEVFRVFPAEHPLNRRRAEV